MSHSYSRLLFTPALLVGLLGRTAAAQAQEPPKVDQPPVLFKQVISAPNGKNGYEDLVLAADALSASKQYSKVAQLQADGKLTLAAKRYVLLDPPVVRALALLKRGLAKPVGSPRDPATLSVETPLPELAHFRSLARLLQLQQYVFLADGRTSDAIANARLCLRLGQAIQTDTLISGLVGGAVSALCISSLGAHLDQFSARDCEQLYAVCREWLQQPDPLPGVVASERGFLTAWLTDIRNKGVGVLEERLGVHAAAPKDPDPSGPIAELKRLNASSPAEFAALLGQVEQQLTEGFDRVLAELKKPPWQRKLGTVSLGGEGLAGRLLGLIQTNYGKINDAYAREEARVCLLACHTAILRYRWEHDALPPDLAALDLGDMALDPFTGQPLQYENLGTRYRLSSVGAVTTDDDPKAVNGRRPVSIVPGDF
jgi:hypothetical protein